MLTQIYVKDFILMDNVNLHFHEHMSAFTGETGAGKSLLMDAIGILKGDRISASMVKEGKDKAIIEGVFEVDSVHPAVQMLEESGFTLEDKQLIVTREFTREGKSIARLNHRPTTVSFLRDVLATLLDLHSQHDTQYLLNAKYHLSLLDSFFSEDDLKKEVKETYGVYKKICDDLQHALQHDYNEDDLEFLTYQLNEIDQAELKEDELDELEDQLKKMQAYEKISSNIQQSVELLEGENGSNAQLYEAQRKLSSLHEDDLFVTWSEKLLDAYYTIEDTLETMKDYVANMEYDEALFNKVQDRIFLIHKIYRKYGGTFQAVCLKREELEQSIDSILHRQDFLNKQEQRKTQAYEQYRKAADKLHAIREKQARQLEKKILIQLADLELKNARFHVDFQTFEGNATGIDNITFMIAMNAGEPLKSLSTTASGGELSRFMLGLKTVFTTLQGIQTVIFDEIDTGVSGSVAFAIGKKMQELANDVQVFCVTHLAAVAACADQHYIVEKSQTKNQTKTDIRKLDTQERIDQLALISSNSLSSSAKEAAKELFERAIR